MDEEARQQTDNNDNIYLSELTQDEICKYCEQFILGCKHSTITFICEGVACEEAFIKANNYYLDWNEANLLQYLNVEWHTYIRNHFKTVSYPTNLIRTLTKDSELNYLFSPYKDICLDNELIFKAL